MNWTVNDTHIQTKMLKWPIRGRNAVNRSGYGYGGKRVNPTNLALDGRKLVDYSSSDDSSSNDGGSPRYHHCARCFDYTMDRHRGTLNGAPPMNTNRVHR